MVHNILKFLKIIIAASTTAHSISMLLFPYYPNHRTYAWRWTDVVLNLYYSLGTQRSVRPLSPASEKKIEETLRKMIEYYKYHGVNLRTCYEDFDVHHIGKITESQVFST